MTRERKHHSTEARSSPDKQTQRLARESKRLAGKRDELIGTVYELYGRCNEVVLRIQDDVRTLYSLQQETTELIYILLSLPSERPPAQVPTPAPAAPTLDSGPRLPRLIPFREVAQRVALSRSTIWRMERAGQFPKRRRLSVNKVAWWEPEIEEWLQNRQLSDGGSLCVPAHLTSDRCTEFRHYSSHVVSCLWVEAQETRSANASG